MNLSYCRFQNTLIDFRECVKAVEEDAELSDAETSAMLQGERGTDEGDRGDSATDRRT